MENHSDGAIVLIESGKVSYRNAREVKGYLEMAGYPVIGVVLNKVERNGSGYYYKQYYYKYEKCGETMTKRTKNKKWGGRLIPNFNP